MPALPPPATDARHPTMISTMRVGSSPCPGVSRTRSVRVAASAGAGAAVARRGVLSGVATALAAVSVAKPVYAYGGQKQLAAMDASKDASGGNKDYAELAAIIAKRRAEREAAGAASSSSGGGGGSGAREQ